MARLAATGVAGVEPSQFGLGSAPAVRKALERAGWNLSDVDRYEINEAFAAVPLAVAHRLSLREDVSIPEGCAVAHSPPIGATGSVLTVRLLHAMREDWCSAGW